MYSIIRLTIGCIFLICSTMGIKKTQFVRKRILYVVFTILSFSIFVVSMFLPFENLFITFDSPKAAYEYFNSGESNIALIVEGEDCDFVIDRENDSDTYLIIPKTSDGWKIGIGSRTRRIAQKVSGGIVVYVYQYKNTNDCFLKIFDTNGGESTITDEYNTEFFSLERYDDSLDKKFVTYYAHITEFNTQYSVIVNGNKIVLEN